jgi:hypothetical protein
MKDVYIFFEYLINRGLRTKLNLKKYENVLYIDE